MTCEICGADRADAGAACRRCGHPAVSEEAARALAEAVASQQGGELDRAIRQVQQAVKAAPAAWLPQVRLGALYERKVAAGESALERLADRAYAEAVKLAPLEREVHVARLGLAARLGRLPFLRMEYEKRRDEWPFAGDCLKMIEALEQAAAPPAGGELRFRHTPPRLLFLAGGIGLLLGIALLSVVTWGSVNDEHTPLWSQPALYVSIVLITAAAVLLLEGWRGRQAREQT